MKSKLLSLLIAFWLCTIPLQKSSALAEVSQGITPYLCLTTDIVKFLGEWPSLKEQACSRRMSVASGDEVTVLIPMKLNMSKSVYKSITAVVTIKAPDNSEYLHTDVLLLSSRSRLQTNEIVMPEESFSFDIPMKGANQKGEWQIEVEINDPLNTAIIHTLSKTITVN
jgi:hypothetical protein